MARALTPNQARFVSEYLIDLNATQAAIRAGYTEKGATVRGAELLVNLKVQAAIQKAMRERESRMEVKADQVVGELRRVAFFDPGALFDLDKPTLTFKSLKDIPADVRRCISSMKIRRLEGDAEVIEVKFADKMAALRLLGQHLGMFDSDQGGENGRDVNFFITIQQRLQARIDAYFVGQPVEGEQAPAGTVRKDRLKQPVDTGGPAPDASQVP